MHISAALAASTLALAAAQLSPFAPEIVDCPSHFELLRPATGLSDAETTWLAARDNVTRTKLIDFLDGAGLDGFSAPSVRSFVENSTIRIGIAISGGGYRAMLTGAGVVNALDSRVETNATAKTGSLSGLLDATSYIAGLSGGSWLVASLAGNNFTTPRALQESEFQWEFQNLFTPVNTTGADSKYWFDTIAQDIYEKRLSGFNTSLTDLWSLGLGAQLLGGENLDWGANVTLSSLAHAPALAAHAAPLPIIVADHAPNSTVSSNSTVIEITPFEFGSWDPSLASFANTTYLGSPANNGTVKKCVNGFDNLAFALGTSSSLFNQAGLSLLAGVISGSLPIQADVRAYDNFDVPIAVWNPNPFNGTAGAAAITGDELLLADGGENGESIPLQPLIQPERGLDIVFAVDSDSDYQGFPDGSALEATFRRQFTSQGRAKFPYVPSTQEILRDGLNQRPSFFGVDARNLSSLWNSSVPESERNLPPVIVYLPNSRYTYPSNISTLELEFGSKVRDGMIANGEAIATLNGTTSDWRQCVSCAIIVREQQRRGLQPSNQCQQCFQKYAWPPVNGTSSA